jgi:hypothetical protein
MAMIPPALDSDSDDVVWALQTSSSLWERGELQDALTWLRRAAELAAETTDHARALDLAHAVEALARHVQPVPSTVVEPAATPLGFDFAAMATEPTDVLPTDSMPDLMPTEPGAGPAVFPTPVIVPEPAVPPQEPGPTAQILASTPTENHTPFEDGDEDVDDGVVTSAPPMVLLDRLRNDDGVDSVKDSVEPDAVPLYAEPTLCSEPDVQDPPAVPLPISMPKPPIRLPTPKPVAVHEASGEDASAFVAEAAVEPPAESFTADVVEPTQESKMDPMMESTEPSLDELEPIEVVSVPNPPPPPRLRPPPPPKLSPKPAPKVSAPTELAEATLESSQAPTDFVPEASPAAEDVPEASPAPEDVPEATPSAEDVPEASPAAEDVPEATPAPEDVPEATPAAEVATTAFVVPPPAQRGLRPRRPSVLPSPGTKAPPLVFDEPLVANEISDISPVPPGRIEEPLTESEQSLAKVPDLIDVEAFADMSEEARRDFERQAVMHELRTDEEVAGFALAWVERGEVAVMAIVSDIPAVQLRQGDVLRSRGTVDERVPLRLVCTSESATVAVWSDESVAVSFEALPWVEEDLRDHADRVHALVGVTLGPLGEAFGQEMLEQISARLETRRYIEGEEVVGLGEPLPGLLILGVGILEVLGDDGSVSTTLDVGTILFPGSLLSMEDAPATVRAGGGGAVVLMVDRSTAQEMIMTFPSLLEELARG